MSRPSLAAIVSVGVAACVCSALWAGERSIKAEPQNYTSVPLVARSSTAKLIERSASSGSSSSSGAKSGGASASRTLMSGSSTAPSGALVSGDDSGEASRLVSSNTITTKEAQREYWLKGDVKCWNKSRKDAVEFGLLVVPFDEYHNSLSTGRVNVARVKGWIVGGGEETLGWEMPLNAPKVEEIAVAILTIKFGDGTIWKAPDVELVDFF